MREAEGCTTTSYPKFPTETERTKKERTETLSFLLFFSFSFSFYAFWFCSVAFVCDWGAYSNTQLEQIDALFLRTFFIPLLNFLTESNGVKHGIEGKELELATMEDVIVNQSKFRRICVFCGSSHGKKRSYQDSAIELANELVTNFPIFLFGSLFAL